MLSYFHFALSPISTKLIITHPRAARYQLARSPRIHPPTSFVPLTVPTILHPAGPFGLTWKVRCSPRWIYGKHLIRRHVSATIASGAVGKRIISIDLPQGR
jgi:hypothetical protein